MLKSGIAASLLTFICGIAGYYLRNQELRTVFDETTGLAAENAPVSIGLIALSAAIFIISVLLNQLVKNKKMSFSEAYGSKNPIPCFLLCIAGAVMVAVSGYMFITDSISLDFKDTVWAVLTILAGLSIIILAAKVFLSSNGREPGLITMIPVVYLCAWLLISYTDRAADPVLLHYVYEFFALAFTIMGFYYLAGFAFGKMRGKSMLVCSNVAVYFILVNLAEDIGMLKKAVYICLAVVLLIQSLLLGKNLNIPDDTKTSEEQAPETPPEDGNLGLS